MTDTQTGSTETATTTTTDAGGLTAGELAYFKSGGEDVSGLEGAGDGSTATNTATTTTTETGTTRAPAADEGADAIEGEVSIEPDGTVRDRKTGRFVPHGAFAKERTARQEADRARQELSEKYARVDERLQILTGALDPAAKAAEKTEEVAPDPEADIFGAFKHAMTKIANLEKRLTDGDATAKAREEAANIETTYRADAARFAAATPDFAQAYTFVIKGRDAELQALGVTDQKERARIIASDERDLVQTALSGKRSPAETLYKYAQARGYKSLPVSDTASEKNAATADATAKLDAIERGQNATRSLATTGGGAPAGLTAETLANMPMEEFEAFVKNNGAKFKALLGG